MKDFDTLYQEIVQQTKDYPTNFFAALKQDKKRRVVLYGAGGNCQCAIYTCLWFVEDINIECICDSNLRGIYTYKHTNGDTTKYQIITPDQLLEEYRDAYVLITTWKYETEIRSQLIQSGFPSNQIFYLRFQDIITPKQFREKYLEGYRWAYQFFNDDRSRQRIAARIRLHLTGEACPQDSAYDDGYFAYPDIRLDNGEVYVDCGAYIGDTAEKFVQTMEATNKKYSYIYAFEPDYHNIKVAQETLSAYDRTELVPKGVWRKPDTLFLTSKVGGDYIGSNLEVKLPQENESIVPVTSLDAFFADKTDSEWPTLIKMDIEGAEKEALLGAKEIIKQKKPKLIICAYHKPEDIYELPQTILKLRNDYRLCLWQIGEGFWDIVLYAD